MKISRYFGISLLLLVFEWGWGGDFSFAQEAGSATTVATVGLKVTLVGINSYPDFQAIRAALTQSEGVEKITLDTEAPGVVTFQVRYEGEPRSLIEKLEAFFPKKYSMVEKHLPSGFREITISNRGS